MGPKRTKSRFYKVVSWGRYKDNIGTRNVKRRSIFTQQHQVSLFTPEKVWSYGQNLLQRLIDVDFVLLANVVDINNQAIPWICILILTNIRIFKEGIFCFLFYVGLNRRHHLQRSRNPHHLQRHIHRRGCVRRHRRCHRRHRHGLCLCKNMRKWEMLTFWK